MRFGMASNAWRECEVPETCRGMRLNEDFLHFLADNYGERVKGVFVGLICHHPEHRPQTRTWFDRSSSTLYIDVELNFDLMRAGDVTARRRHLLEVLGEVVPDVTSKYASPHFDGVRFGQDFREWVRNYPSFPVSAAPARDIDKRLERLSGPAGELRKIVLEEFGPLASTLGLSFKDESVQGHMHVISFESSTRRVDVISEFAPGSVGIRPEMRGESRAKARVLDVQYVKLPSDGFAPLMLTTMTNKADEVVAQVALARAGDFRVALRALAEFFEQNPQVLFPEKKNRTKLV